LKEKDKVIYIKILESKLLLDEDLDNLIKYFNCKLSKENILIKFPDRFVSKLTLNYIGSVPDYKIFNSSFYLLIYNISFYKIYYLINFYNTLYK